MARWHCALEEPVNKRLYSFEQTWLLPLIKTLANHMLSTHIHADTDLTIINTDCGKDYEVPIRYNSLIAERRRAGAERLMRWFGPRIAGTAAFLLLLISIPTTFRAHSQAPENMIGKKVDNISFTD